MNKTRKKPPFHDKFHFDEIWERILSETPLRRYKELSEIIGNTPQNITKRKDENYFPPDWAFYVGIKFNLSTEWIMTGEGSIRKEAPTPIFRNEFLYEVDKWLTKEIEKEPFREGWFEGTFLDAFPLFTKWRKSLEQEQGKDTSIQNKAA